MFLRDQSRQLLFVGVAHHAADALHSGDFLGRTLRVTTGHHDAGAGVLAVNPPDRLTGLGIGSPSDGAGVDDHDVRGRSLETLLQVLSKKRLLEGRSIRLAGPAAEVEDRKSWVSHLKNSDSCLTGPPELGRGPATILGVARTGDVIPASRP